MPVYDGHYMMWGLHWGWWLFCIAIIAAVIYAIVRSGDRKVPKPDSNSAREILDRRYAAGEISTEEYQERKAALAGKHG